MANTGAEVTLGISGATFFLLLCWGRIDGVLGTNNESFFPRQICLNFLCNGIPPSFWQHGSWHMRLADGWGISHPAILALSPLRLQTRKFGSMLTVSLPVPQFEQLKALIQDTLLPKKRLFLNLAAVAHAPFSQKCKGMHFCRVSLLPFCQLLLRISC